MAGNIKGLTVEIGGDTTKLGKALEDVNKKSKGLSSELGQINKLLKLDPGNADLLAQKQKVLAEAIVATSNKLETLKEAEKQVQKQFERGEVSEEQVRALQREIIATDSKLSKYAVAAQETAEAIERLGDESDDASEGLDDTGDKAKTAAKQVDDLADASNKAGSGLGAAATAAGTFIGNLALDVLKAAIEGLGNAIEASREYRAEMGKLDVAFTTSGHSSESATAAYKTLQGVIGETDQAVEAAQQIALLANSEQDVAAWSELAAGVVGRFGDALQPETFYESANETLKLGEATGAYVQMIEGAGGSVEEFNKGLAKCKTEAEKQAYMLEYTQSVLGEAADAYNETNAEIIRSNQANEAWMASMAEIGGAIDPIITDVKMLGASLLSELVPGVQKVAEALRGMLNGDAGAADALGSALSGIITQLLDKVVELAPAIVTAGMSLLTTLTTTLIGMLPQLVTTGVQLLMSVIQGLTQAIPRVVQAIVGMIPQMTQALVTGLPQLIQGAVQLLLALVDAIPQIIPPLVAALPQIVMAIINGLLTALPQLLNGAVQFFMAIIQAIPRILNMLLPQIPTIVTTIVNGLIQNIPVLLRGTLQLLQAIVDAIPLILEALIPQLPVIVESIVTGLLEMFPLLLDAAIQLFMALIQAIPQIVMLLIQNLPQILTAIVSVLGSLGSLIGGILSDVLTRVGQWIGNMVSKAAEMGSKFISSVGTFFSQLPGNIATFLSNALTNVATWATDLATKGGEAASDLVSKIVETISSLPGDMLSAGEDLVKGIWDGISGATQWIKDKITEWVGDVTKFLKKLFGIKSPSRLMRDEIGRWLPRGIGVGVEKDAHYATDAMDELSRDLVDAAEADVGGLTFERDINYTTRHNKTPASVAEALAMDNAALLAKLDGIYERLGSLQVVLDSGATVGGLIDNIDAALATRQTLRARGV